MCVFTDLLAGHTLFCEPLDGASIRQQLDAYAAGALLRGATVSAVTHYRK